LKPKHDSRRYFRVSGSDFSFVQCILFTLEENDLHWHSKAADPSMASTLISFDLPLATLVGTAEKRKKVLTCT
jgi:hypothetical protein